MKTMTVYLEFYLMTILCFYLLNLASKNLSQDLAWKLAGQDGTHPGPSAPQPL